MKAIHIKRLRKLADHIERVEPEHFDFSQIFRWSPPDEEQRIALPDEVKCVRDPNEAPCGTVGCAIGWMPTVWPKRFEWRPVTFRAAEVVDVKTEKDDFEAAADWFGMSYDDAKWLFGPGGAFVWDARRSTHVYRPHKVDSEATPKQVATHIRRYARRMVKKHGIEVSA